MFKTQKVRRQDMFRNEWSRRTNASPKLLATIIQKSFIQKNGNRRYKILVLGRKGPYFVDDHSDSKSKYTEDDIINMLEFLVDNMFVVFGEKVFLPTESRHSYEHK